MEERHNCKLCLKNFSNGRALGGHMRSHMLVASIHQQPLPEAAASSSSDDQEDQPEKALYHGLRKKSKRSICMVDPFAANTTTTTTTCVVQDDESETESSKTTRRRSKRSLKSMEYSYVVLKEEDKVKLLKTEDTCSNLEAEPVSSISDATTEEDLAFCLMMLSRDKWSTKRQAKEEEEEEEESSKSLKKKGRGGKYRCETCKKLFKSYQALGGHRASHKKMKSSVAFRKPVESLNNQNKIHECPYCYRVFSSGQALGGHKRSHLITSSSAPTNNLIDLNLPAPTTEDDDITQIELSALSDAEFLHHLI